MMLCVLCVWVGVGCWDVGGAGVEGMRMKWSKNGPKWGLGSHFGGQRLHFGANEAILGLSRWCLAPV